MDTPKYGETLKFVYKKYQPILVKSYQRFTKFNYYFFKLWCNQNKLWKLTISSRRLDLITRDQCLTQQLFSA